MTLPNQSEKDRTIQRSAIIQTLRLSITTVIEKRICTFKRRTWGLQSVHSMLEGTPAEGSGVEGVARRIQN